VALVAKIASPNKIVLRLMISWLAMTTPIALKLRTLNLLILIIDHFPQNIQHSISIFNFQRKQTLPSLNLLPMKALLKQVIINDPASPHHQLKKDVFIVAGIIQEIADSIQEKADTEIFEEGLTISPGWVDVFANFCDPGLEYKETLESGSRAAAAGGFTHVMVIPNTKPVVDVKSTVEYIVQKSANLPVKIIPIGAISKNAEGKELAEMYDMQSSGAGAFSDGLNPVQSAGMLVKALQYIKAFDGVLIQVPEDKTIAPHGLVNEGIISTQLGLPGKPIMAEELIIARDIKLSRYTDSHLTLYGSYITQINRIYQQGQSRRIESYLFGYPLSSLFL
jgi:dihydroorotase